MGRNGVNDKGIRFLTKVLSTSVSLLIIAWDIATYGKPAVTHRNKTVQSNSSQRHFVVTEEEVQDTLFIPHQPSYPVIPQYPVPIITQSAAQPQPSTKKPKIKHANEHEEQHVLMPPRKTESASDEHARNSKNTGSIGNSAGKSVYSETSGDNNRTTEDKSTSGDKNTWTTGNSAENSVDSGNSVDRTRNTEDIWDSGENEIEENSDNKWNKEKTSPQLTSTEFQKLKTYRSIGCYKDTLPRAVPSLEGSDPVLNGYYKNRLNAVEKCAQVARSRGYQVFTIQNGGFCSSGPMAHRTFQIYGPAKNCKCGKGGQWANDVYIFNLYAYELTIHTGNEQKSSTDAKVGVALYGVMGSSRHIYLRSHISSIINDPFQSGQVDKFTVHTVPLGDLIRLHVCIDNTGPTPAWYLEKISIKDPRNKFFIFPCNCWLKGRKKGSISERNLLPAVVINPESFKYLGCFKHAKSNKIVQDYQILDGRPSTSTFDNTKPKNKDYVIEMCAQGAHARGYMFFAIHNGDQCLSSSIFQNTYGIYGSAYDCLKTGRGGVESMAVYTFIDREPPGPITTANAT